MELVKKYIFDYNNKQYIILTIVDNTINNSHQIPRMSSVYCVE